MRAREGLRIAVGVLLMVALAWAILAAPGFLSDQASIVTVTPSSQDAAR